MLTQDINGKTEKSLEEIYTKKALGLFNREADKKLNPLIIESIQRISSSVECALRISLPPEQEKDKFVDIIDFIDSRLLNNQLFAELLDEFIEKKSSSSIKIITQTETNSEIFKTKELTDKNIDEIVDQLDKHSIIIMEYILIIEEHKQTIEGMIEALNSKTLNAAKRIKIEIKKEFESNLLNNK
ncbi:MAG: hypothetical protein QM490_02970 [Candidatus Gracilibacteria bacterium]